MAISTNSVIHYTDNFKSLIGIIKSNGFRLKYCIEETRLHEERFLEAAFPLVSFCDIPLSEVKNHIDAYGSYGIGLTKNWAKNTGLNPVLYIERNSRLANNLDKQIVRMGELYAAGKRDVPMEEEMFTHMGYIKNYEGRLVRGKINNEFYRFYDEREWRFVALEKDLNNNVPFIDAENYIKAKQEYNDKISDCYVKFIPSDITYLILDKEEEIPELLTILTEVYDDTITAKELKILSTKILTKNQIYNDF